MENASRVADQPEAGGAVALRNFVQWENPPAKSGLSSTFSRFTADGVIWILAAMGSGVVGNAAYSALSRLLSARRTKGLKTSSLPVDDVVAVGRVAAAAVQEKAAGEDGVAESRFSTVDLTSDNDGTYDILVDLGSDAVEVTFRSPNEFLIKVCLDPHDLSVVRFKAGWTDGNSFCQNS